MALRPSLTRGLPLTSADEGIIARRQSESQQLLPVAAFFNQSATVAQPSVPRSSRFVHCGDMWAKPPPTWGVASYVSRIAPTGTKRDNESATTSNQRGVE